MPCTGAVKTETLGCTVLLMFGGGGNSEFVRKKKPVSITVVLVIMFGQKMKTGILSTLFLNHTFR